MSQPRVPSLEPGEREGSPGQRSEYDALDGFISVTNRIRLRPMENGFSRINLGELKASSEAFSPRLSG